MVLINDINKYVEYFQLCDWRKGLKEEYEGYICFEGEVNSRCKMF